MKSSILYATLFTAAVATAAIAPPGVGLPPVPSASPVPGSSACGRVVDLAVLAAETAVNRALQPFGIAELKDAVKAGTATFKHEIGCGSGGDSGDRPGEEEPGWRDCSGMVDYALDVAVKTLKSGFQFARLPEGYERGVEGGVKAFKKTLGCKQQAQQAQQA